MIIILKPGTQLADAKPLCDTLTQRGVIIQQIIGESTTMIGLAGDTSQISPDWLMSYRFVDKVMKVQEPYKLAGLKFHPLPSVFDIGGRLIGGGNFAVAAGPCSVETPDQILAVAQAVKASGAAFLRGGAFKPRTSPYAFSGLGLEGLALLKHARQQTGLPIVTEITSREYLDDFARDVDIVQIGARNMQNFSLLREVGQLKKPVLIKRGMSSTIDELLMAAEYVMASGSSQVILCERGIRTFETSTRNTLDISAIPVLKSRTHLPVIVDPSHSSGNWRFVQALSLAAVAAGADGLIIEVHNCPECALCDGAQSITPAGFDELMNRIAKLRGALESM